MIEEDENGNQVTYDKVHVSFQSTSSCNIGSVNVLNQVHMFTVPKERGQGEHKRRWVIEMNEARQFYLKTYGRIDTIDAAVKTQQIGYISWKYWHSAKNHGLAVANVMAYSFYKEVMTEPKALEYFGITPSEAENAFMPFAEFMQVMSNQGLLYHPLQRRLPLDSLLRVNTQQGWGRSTSKRSNDLLTEEDHDVESLLEASSTICNRRRGRPNLTEVEVPGRVTKRIFKEAMKGRVIQKRLLGDITTRLDSMTAMQSRNGKVCRWCGVVAFTYCSKCSDKPALHFYTTKGASKGKGCALHYHNTNCFGLAKADAVGVSLPIKQWREPSKRTMALHSDYMGTLCKEVRDEDETQATTS
jgi:hypothetical protein